MRLTFRQKVFLGKLLDLYRESEGPLHYSVVAERLGVSRATAYDMLRLLEQKGLVVSHYQLPKGNPGPGRSSVLFAPSPRAKEALSNLVGEIRADPEWEEVKGKVLSCLRRGKGKGYQKLLEELLSKVPQSQSPLACCAEFITALLLSLREIKYSLGPQSPLRVLLSRPGTKLGMSMLAGLAAGLMLADKAGRKLLANLERHIQKYKKSLEELSQEQVETLQGYTEQVISFLNAEK